MMQEIEGYGNLVWQDSNQLYMPEENCKHFPEHLVINLNSCPSFSLLGDFL
jgi:hypothetical protein